MKSKKPEVLLVRTRGATEQDVPRLHAMICALAKHHGDNPELDLKALRRDIFAEIPWIYVLVAEVDNEVVGYAALCPLIQLQVGMRGIDMHHLFVEKGFRGAGVGKALVSASMAKARDLHCKYMMVGTHPDNTDAQAFYLAYGFEARHGNAPRFGIRLALDTNDSLS